jgi:uncharacterized membrane protein
MSEVASRRLAALDLHRGAIMAFMALDHASMFVAGVHFSEFWGLPLPDYGSTLALFTRVISHLCAPGFFFTMGIGMHLFAASRRSQGVSEGRIIRHFAIRGAILIVLDVFVVTPAWVLGSLETFLEGEAPMGLAPGQGGTLMMAVGVLACLGAAMLLSSVLMRLSGWGAASLGLAIVLACQVLLPSADKVGEVYPALWRLLLIAGHDGFLMVVYPVLPWFGVSLLGIGYGHWLERDPGRALRSALPAGIVLLVVFVLVRGAGGFGTHHPVADESLMAFFSVTKYPPSVAFLLFALGANALLLSGFQGIASSGRLLGGALLVFGRTPLFFYVVHLYLYAVLGLSIPGETSLPGMYPVWIVGLVLLYPICRRYDVFKQGTERTSIWRLF